MSTTSRHIRVLLVSGLVSLGLFGAVTYWSINAAPPSKFLQAAAFCGPGHTNHHTGHITNRISRSVARKQRLTAKIRKLENRKDNARRGSDRRDRLRERIQHLRDKRATVNNRTTILRGNRRAHHAEHHEACRTPTPAPTVTVTESPSPGPTVTVTPTPTPTQTTTPPPGGGGGGGPGQPPDCGVYGRPPC